MTRAIAPDGERVRDSLRGKDDREALIFTAANIGLAGRENDLHAIDRGVVEIGEKIRRAVVVAVVVVVSVQKLMDVECATHAHRAGHHFRIPQREVDCVIPAEAAAGGH